MPYPVRAIIPKPAPEIRIIPLQEQSRARRIRRVNFSAYLLIWLAFFAYALWVFGSASNLPAAIDQFLPVQLVAGLAALAVFVSGRSLSRRSMLRRISGVPTAFTSFGIAISLAVIAAVDTPKTLNNPPMSTEVEVPRGPMLVSL